MPNRMPVHEVSRRRAEREGEQDGQPVEGLSPVGEDRVDRQGVLARIPEGEGCDQGDGEEDG